MLWLSIVTVIWLVFLSFYLYKTNNHYQRLIKIGGRQDLTGILEKILDRLEEDRINLDKIKKDLEKVIKDGEIHIQKIGLVRFNPFTNTGGDQSFVLSLLDKYNNGVVISSLHSRTTTRWYAKTVIKGKGKNTQLSKEEEKAIQKAEKY